MSSFMRQPEYKGIGINVYQQEFTNLLIGDTFFDADYGMVIWNGKTWQQNDLVKRASYIEGELVCYIPYNGCDESLWENGIVKEAMASNVRVVYHPGDEWANFREYTSALTPINSLRRGWVTTKTKEENENI